nr:hypothetical protein CFP56_17305 [Quercus suber]
MSQQQPQDMQTNGTIEVALKNIDPFHPIKRLEFLYQIQLTVTMGEGEASAYIIYYCYIIQYLLLANHQNGLLKSLA